MALTRVSKWHDVRDVGQDCYGKILIQKGTTKGGLVIYRQRRKQNKTRFMYWSDVGRIRSTCFDDVLCEILPNYDLRS